MFAAAVDDDTYTVASEVHDLLVKIHAADTEKIELIKELVWDFLEIDRFRAAAAESSPVP
jgi:BioD-like phosphotransacetylase family protein